MAGKLNHNNIYITRSAFFSVEGMALCLTSTSTQPGLTTITFSHYRLPDRNLIGQTGSFTMRSKRNYVIY